MKGTQKEDRIKTTTELGLLATTWATPRHAGNIPRKRLKLGVATRVPLLRVQHHRDHGQVARHGPLPSSWVHQNAHRAKSPGIQQLPGDGRHHVGCPGRSISSVMIGWRLWMADAANLPRVALRRPSPPMADGRDPLWASPFWAILVLARPVLVNPILANPIWANPFGSKCVCVSWSRKRWGQTQKKWGFGAKGGPEGWGPSGGGPQVGSLRLGPEGPFSLFLFLSGCFLVEFWLCLKRREPEMCTFGLV